jgi:hypothetical protein
MRLLSFLIVAFVLIGIAFVFYLSWLPLPRLGLLWFIPKWVARWADDQPNDSLRTAVPFIFLGGLLGVWHVTKGRLWPSWLAAWLLLVITSALAEAGQTFLPHRSFDWLDIGWGAAGAGLGLGVVACVYALTMWVQNREVS